jgi:hypothetical protein
MSEVVRLDAPLADGAFREQALEDPPSDPNPANPVRDHRQTEAEPTGVDRDGNVEIKRRDFR